MVEGWLDPEETGSQELVDEVVDGAGDVADRVRFHRVGAAVGSVDNNSESLMEPVA
jgi:hypothetical protein